MDPPHDRGAASRTILDVAFVFHMEREAPAIAPAVECHPRRPDDGAIQGHSRNSEATAAIFSKRGTVRNGIGKVGHLLTLVVEHKHKIGFQGRILLEPKPMEPTKHQYDHDVATIYGFLSRHGLEKEIGVNIECNHATLAGHSFEHEVATAVALGIFGSVDANRGDVQNGWDTDQFPNDVRETALALHHILNAGGLANGGFNFDAKVRRQSTDPIDLFHGHIGGIDTLAKGLLVAAELIETQALTKPLGERYADWDGALGRSILAGQTDLAGLADKVLTSGIEPSFRSGHQEAPHAW
jgi:xylose isomerase